MLGEEAGLRVSMVTGNQYQVLMNPSSEVPCVGFLHSRSQEASGNGPWPAAGCPSGGEQSAAGRGAHESAGEEGLRRFPLRLRPWLERTVPPLYHLRAWIIARHTLTAAEHGHQLKLPSSMIPSLYSRGRVFWSFGAFIPNNNGQMLFSGL